MGPNSSSSRHSHYSIVELHCHQCSCRRRRLVIRNLVCQQRSVRSAGDSKSASGPATRSHTEQAAMSSPQRQAQGTPRAARPNIPSSSPFFFRSSPVTGRAGASGHHKMDTSSPVRQSSNTEDPELTPRGRAHPPNG